MNIVYYYNDLLAGRQKNEFFLSIKPGEQTQHPKFDTSNSSKTKKPATASQK